MDRDYLQQIEASLYVNEAFPQGMKSNMAALGQKVKRFFGSKSKAPEKAPPGSVPPVIPPTPKPSPRDSSQQVSDDFTALVLEVLKSIAKRIQSDRKRAEPYYAKQMTGGGYYLPQTWEEPSPTDPEWKNIPAKEKDPFKRAEMEKGGHYIQTADGWRYVPPEIHEADEPVDKPADEPETAKKDTETKEFEKSGYFIKDFAGLYRKHPGGWSIEITEGGGQRITLPSGKVKIIRVFWSWNKRENSIYIKSRDDAPGSQWVEGTIMKFFDDQVVPRSPTSPQFSAGHFVAQASPKAAELFDKGERYHSAIAEAEKEVRPALYAIIRRKGAMEYKIDQDELELELLPGSGDKSSDKYGWIRVLSGKEKGERSRFIQMQSINMIGLLE